MDTGIVLTAMDEPKSLSRKIRQALDQGPAHLSVIAYWEVMIKSIKGNLDVGDPRDWWKQTLRDLDLAPLPFQPDHVAMLRTLPAIHQDPFDRAMIAQAMVEDLVLLTADREIPQYARGNFQAIT